MNLEFDTLISILTKIGDVNYLSTLYVSVCTVFKNKLVCTLFKMYVLVHTFKKTRYDLYFDLRNKCYNVQFLLKQKEKFYLVDV